jgi:arylsulfatase
MTGSGNCGVVGEGDPLQTASSFSRRDFVKRGGGWLAGAVLAASSGITFSAEASRRPNILLILADDLGFSDLGCYGGEIQTPTLDALAGGGLRFTEFYNSARCCPSRASLLTGLYPHQAGMGAMDNDQGAPGYRGHLNDQCVTIAEVLRGAGYRTLMSGKWHLSKPGPIDRGFEEFFGLLHGFDSYWNAARYTRLPEGHPRREYPEGRFYSTDAISDHALDFIAEARRATDRPFFLYLAFNAPHFPLHAPKEEIAKYADLYAKGWDAVREERYARMKRMGLLDPRWPLSPRSIIGPNRVSTPGGFADKQNPAWDSIDADRRADLARRMAVYAAAVDRMDQNVGRVIADLRVNRQLDNTLILFLSDNGACAEWDPWGFDEKSGPTNVLHKGADLDTLGGPGTYISYGSGWANASNTPLTLYKHYAHEGGISTPLIVHWPAGMKRRGEIDPRPGHLTDVMATCVEVAGATYPKSVDGRDILPPEGQSLIPAVRGEPAKERTLFFEHEGSRAVRRGKWKLVALANRPWELYDEDADRVEMKNVAAEHPDLVKGMSQQWDAWARRCNVLK